MLEGLVAWVLNNYLGKYVENLNTDQLSVALLSGKVELENLPLKKDALRHLGLPVEVKTGFIGKVQLHVPVRQIRSAPWLIAIEKLYVVAAPVNLDEWDSTVEANISHERKIALLDALEAQWRAEHETSDGGYYATSYSSWLSYGTGLLANIVENLQLKINDVHIRYEDALTCAPSAFACGLTAESLTAESCDKEWVRGFTLLTDTDGCSFKLLELHKLAVYWDPVNVPTGLYANYTLAELTTRMCQTWRNPHSYLLPPASALARVRRERTEQPLRSYTRPRIKCNLTLDKVGLNLTSRQYNEAAGCSMGLERIGRLREFRSRRPNVPVAQAPREWWLYALKSHLPDHTWTDPKPTWESCLERSKKIRQYVDICLLILNNPTATLPPEQKSVKDEFEWQTPLHLLKPLREIAMRKVPVSTPVSGPVQPSSSGRSALVHWFPQWWGWYGSTSTPETPLNTTPALEEEILDVIADSLENNTLLKRDTVFGHFEFTLNKGSLNLSMVNGDSDTSGVGNGGSLELAFERVIVRVESRPRASSHALHVELGAVCLKDKITRDTLFPVLVAPQGMIRESLSAMNPMTSSWNWGRSASSPPPPSSAPPLFQLTYEHRPLGLNCDYKVWVSSQPLEVVYSEDVVQWARCWRTSHTHTHTPTLHAPHSTRQRLLNHWEHMMHADVSERRSWHVELDISAPQILLVEDLCDKDGAVLVLDLGRMRLTNAHDDVLPPAATSPVADDELTPLDDDEERFMTPCSTPPGSLLSPASPPDPPAPVSPHPLDSNTLHRRLYDRYDMVFSDLQILVGRARDNWKYAHTKSTSSLHLLDRFSISLQAERRVIHTSDPQFPTATLCGTLPALVVHLSEQKLAYVTNIVQHTQFTFGSNQQDMQDIYEDDDDDDDKSESSETERTEHSVHNNSRLFILQFAIDQMSLEVQSRGRSIAEVQVCGVRAAVTQRPCDTSLSLSVHSLLLVDALQTYGADFELLVASHKHVGMDVQSGSILGSEPTSPASPTSPLPRGRSPPAPALQQAIHSLHQATIHRDTLDGGRTSPLWGAGVAGVGAGVVDEEALIAIELCLVTGPDGDQLRIANILFNSLDIIANQETIVELIGFAQRVMGVNKKKSSKPPAESTITEVTHSPSLLSMAGVGEEVKNEVRTEITFDFQRLGVLLLRAAVTDNGVVAKKIATATLSEAKIRATVGRCMWSVGGSLGGVCVVGLVGVGVHSRVVSAGSSRPAPLAPLAPRALHFHLTRELTNEQTEVSVNVSVHIASVWYTHSGPFLAELRSCVSEFKQYLANLARSIRNAAADMAIGLVQPRSDSLYANPKLSQSMEGVSPRKRTTSVAYSIDDPSDFKERVVLSVQVELETPVVVVSRGARSSEVLVAHLGRMSLSNRPPHAQHEYRLRLRDISLVSMDTADKLKRYKLTDENMSLIYDVTAGKPVLHNTALQLTLNYTEAALDVPDSRPMLEMKGVMVGGLLVTASREQYSQLLDTLNWLGTTGDSTHTHTHGHTQPHTTQESDVDPGAVPTLRLDPAVRAQVLAVHPPHIRNSHNTTTSKSMAVKVNFQLPIFSVELRGDYGKGEKSLVELSFRDFNVNYEQIHPYETSIQVSLHSVTMEDLTQQPDSKHRMLLVSHTPQVPKAVFVSKSCPDFVSQYNESGFTQCMKKCPWGSLPGDLHTEQINGGVHLGVGKCVCPTPPASPLGCPPLSPEDDLVYLHVHTRDPNHPDFNTTYQNVQRHTKVAFNCLQLVLSIDSWVAVLDFFGVAGDEGTDETDSQPVNNQPGDTETEIESVGRLVTEMSVVSLGVVLVSRRGEVCRTRVSSLTLHAATHAPRTRHRTVTVSVAAVSITDLSPHARTHRERFSTDTLNVYYTRLSPAEALTSGHDGTLKIELGPVTYVHTKRFIQQIQTYARDFSMLRTVIQQARQKVSVSRLSRVLMSARCASLSLIVPVSGRAQAALFADLAHVNIDNHFTKAGEEGVLPGNGEMVEVRRVVIESVRVRAGAGRRREHTLLSAPAHLALTLTSNLHHAHTIPDLTIEGTLTTLVCTLDPDQYKLIRGVLAHNLGENCEDLNEDIQHLPPEPIDNQGQVWTTLSIKLTLHDVTVKLEPERGVTSLASINFIKSRLLVETYSDLSQDIDLVSQEILVSDTRYSSEPANRRGNVFTHIVQPLPEHRHSVQAEVHARKRVDSSAYTILVNNMRLMAIFDWWEAANQFIMQPPMPAADPDHAAHEELSACGVRQKSQIDVESQSSEPFELKLNITESQLVLVEDAALWDTNSVILKSTAVITYRTDLSPEVDKPVSCVLNELEVFSCVLGLEEDTALAILDPASLHIDLTRDGTVHFSTSTLNLRLSYHDMRMFASMIKSLPAQARTALSESGVERSAPPLDVPANMRPPRPPVWPRRPVRPPPPATHQHNRITSLQVRADCITLCVIDDCLDSDVPLLEVSLSEMNLEQDLRSVEEAFSDPVLVCTPGVGPPPPRPRPGPAGGRLQGLLTTDYYNRTLSGWEPVIEPWRFETSWEYTLTSNLSLARLQIEVSSTEILDLNVTSTLIELMQLVRSNWTADYYTPQCTSGAECSPKGSPGGYRRRSPFVPYALRNHTGQPLWFTTLTTTSDIVATCSPAVTAPDDSWFVVLGGETEAFSFGGGRPRPRRASPPAPSAPAPARLHQVALRLDHYTPPTPLCVDRVGTYFRNITHTKTGAITRLVFEVSLEGSARKLVTVRSALQLVNKLPHPVEIRVDNAPSTGGVVGGRVWVAGAGAEWSAPLWAVRAPLSVRPVCPAPLAPCPTPLDWRRVADQPLLQHLDCRAPPDHIYRFCCVIVRERFPIEAGGPVAGHTLTLVPALRLENLLPVELHYRVVPSDDTSTTSAIGTLPPGETRPFHEVNVEEGSELSVKLEGFAWSSPLSIGGFAGGSTGNSFTARIKLRDLRAKRLYLTAKVTVKPSDGIKVCIYAGYWLVNRTGNPLVFRAGEGGEAAGQFEEHELARMVAPLVFSFADHDTGPTVAMRLGKGVGPQPEWCSPFGLGVGVSVKRLCVRESESESVRAVGVCVRNGRGRYRHTNIVTVAPRYQLHNNTSRKLLFAQKCTATTINDPSSSCSHVSAVEGCWVPWNWARWERDHVLCVRSVGGGGGGPSHWSGAFSIDTPRTLHISCREQSGGGYWLVRVEVVVQGATLFVVLTDGDRHPPPVRIDNYSPVSVMFHQVGCVEEQVVGGHGRVVWAPGEPEGARGVSLRAPGGPRATLTLDHTDPAQPALLLYQNFIYVAFTYSHIDKGTVTSNTPGKDDNVLVLEVPIGTTRVVLGRKRYGDRSQLWRRGPNEQLIHEGSSPPQPTDALHSEETVLSPHTMVLDIEGPGPRPGRVAALVLRRSDPRRVSTQTWRTYNGFMCCAHNNLAVQPDGGLLGLTPGGRVVLGLQSLLPAPPPDQAVEWHTLRPGSGRLDLTLTTDGPTKVIRITDHKAPEACWLEERDTGNVTGGWGEWGVRAVLGGVGVSLVSREPPAELLYARLHHVTLDLALSHSSAALALKVNALHADNQLLGTGSPVLVHEVPPRASPAPPALHLSADLAHPSSDKYNALYFNHFVVALTPIAVRLEEKLILRLALFVALPDEECAREQPDEADYETQRTLHELTAVNTTRYYFSVIKIIPTQIRLSMCTANKLESELSAVKRRLGLTLIKFEDAAVELEPFVRTHIYETPHYLATVMLKHFKDELKWQAAKILGSVDFLGNPLGFVADVSEGVSGLIYEGNVGALLKNVTHGISNSAAKVTESLGDGLERVVVDEAHEETRRRIRAAAAQGHLAAGFRGLGLGILGGMTSLVKHSYEGATSEGLGGFLAGVGKGLVGTVTKPVIGVLDLAAETASALRDTSRRSDKSIVCRVRAPRCAVGAGGLLPRYCPEQARGAALLHVLNSHDHSDMFLAYCVVRGPPHDIRALVSAHYLRIFTCKHEQPQIVMETHLSNLVSCAVVSSGGASLVELGVSGGEGGPGGAREAVRRPRVQCDSLDIAASLARHLAYASHLYHDLTHTLHTHLHR